MSPTENSTPASTRSANREPERTSLIGAVVNITAIIVAIGFSVASLVISMVSLQASQHNAERAAALEADLGSVNSAYEALQSESAVTKEDLRRILSIIRHPAQQPGEQDVQR